MFNTEVLISTKVALLIKKSPYTPVDPVNEVEPETTKDCVNGFTKEAVREKNDKNAIEE